MTDERLRPERAHGVKPGEPGPPRESESGWGPTSAKEKTADGLW
jgi:hypothetical protein